MEAVAYTEKEIKIIDVAQKLFADKGFAGTSVRDIAKEAEVNIAMISYYFGSKEKLLEAIFLRHAAHVRLQIESILRTQDRTPSQKIELLIEQYIEKYFAKQDFHRLVIREQMTVRDSPISQMLSDMKKNNMLLIKQLISEGQKKGEFRKNIDVPLMMATMLGTTNQMMSTTRFYREMNNLQDMAEDEFEKFIKGKITNHLKTLFKAILTYEPQSVK